MKEKKVSWTNLGVGAAIQLFEVSTLGQPFEVLKTQQAANRADSLAVSVRKIYSQGGVPAFWRGLVPWAWIEAASKGAVLMFTASEVEQHTVIII